MYQLGEHGDTGAVGNGITAENTKDKNNTDHSTERAKGVFSQNAFTAALQGQAGLFAHKVTVSDGDYAGGINAPGRNAPMEEGISNGDLRSLLGIHPEGGEPYGVVGPFAAGPEEDGAAHGGTEDHRKPAEEGILRFGTAKSDIAVFGGSQIDVVKQHCRREKNKVKAKIINKEMFYRVQTGNDRLRRGDGANDQRRQNDNTDDNCDPVNFISLCFRLCTHCIISFLCFFIYDTADFPFAENRCRKSAATQFIKGTMILLNYSATASLSAISSALGFLKPL